MKFEHAIPLFAGIFMIAAIAADTPQPSKVMHFDQNTVSAAFAKAGPIFVTNNFKVQTGNRTAPGEVEIHDHDTDIFYVLEGSATFVTGGKPVDTRSVGPGETRAKEIVGGEARELSKGEVIVIPKGIPHWFREVKGPLLYYVVKVTEK